MPFCFSFVWPQHSGREGLSSTGPLIQGYWCPRNRRSVGHVFCEHAVLKKLLVQRVDQTVTTAEIKSKTSSKFQL
jgi:hypothetical protein